jgi:hypothetical protein
MIEIFLRGDRPELEFIHDDRLPPDLENLTSGRAYGLAPIPNFVANNVRYECALDSQLC